MSEGQTAFQAVSQLSAELGGCVMDDGDRAQTRQLLDTQLALEAQREQAAPGPQLFAGDGVTVLCWECNRPIPTARLAVRPDAAFCVGCLEKIELRHRQGQA